MLRKNVEGLYLQKNANQKSSHEDGDGGYGLYNKSE